MKTHIETLEGLYIEELQDIYDAENRWQKMLSRMAKAAHTSELKRLFEDHLDATRNQIDRLEDIFADRKKDPSGVVCEGMKGLIKECKRYLEAPDNFAKDAGLIAAAQRVEHYEIAAFGTAQVYAITLDHMDEARKLGTCLKEASSADEKMTRLAESLINEKAMKQS